MRGCPFYKKNINIDNTYLKTQQYQHKLTPLQLIEFKLLVRKRDIIKMQKKYQEIIDLCRRINYSYPFQMKDGLI